MLHIACYSSALNIGENAGALYVEGPNAPGTESTKRREGQKDSSEADDLITYADWKLQELISPSRLESCNAPQHLSSAELSSRLASSPKEEEIWATDCAICLSEFAKDVEVRELSCENIFHDGCIHSWFIKAATCACPLCRYSLHSGFSQE